MKKIFLIVIIVLLGISQIVEPADPDEKYGELWILHHAGKIKNNTYRYIGKEKNLPRWLKEKNGYDIHRGEVIQIYVKDPNLFLYKYEGLEISETEIENYTSIEGFLEALKPLLEISEISSAAYKRDIKPSQGENIIDNSLAYVDKIDKQLIDLSLEGMEVSNQISAIQSEIDSAKKEEDKKGRRKKKEKLENERKAIATKIKDLTTKKKSLTEVKVLLNAIEKLGITSGSLHTLAKNIEKLFQFNKGIPVQICKISNDPTSLKEVFDKIDEWDKLKPDGKLHISDYILKAYAKIDEAQDKLRNTIELRDKLEGHDALKISINTTMNNLDLFKHVESKVHTMFKNVNAFKTTFFKMYDKKTGDWKPFPLGTISYKDNKKITAKIKISFIDDLDKDIKKCLNLKIRKTGTFQFIFTPYSPFKITFAASQILSSIKEKGEDSEEEENISLFVPMLTIVPDLWEVKSFRLAFQVGGMVKDKRNNIVIGGGIQLVEKVLIGGGLHIRWGDGIELKKGWYINISFNVLPIKIK